MCVYVCVFVCASAFVCVRTHMFVPVFVSPLLHLISYYYHYSYFLRVFHISVT